ncbi:hypothetical protein FGB62_72g015 [Gracilaria domingensis]|nr:hypothetical protein FGB62_72g015 [Gracilaria domingensis]
MVVVLFGDVTDVLPHLWMLVMGKFSFESEDRPTSTIVSTTGVTGATVAIQSPPAARLIAIFSTAAYHRVALKGFSFWRYLDSEDADADFFVVRAFEASGVEEVDVKSYFCVPERQRDYLAIGEVQEERFRCHQSDRDVISAIGRRMDDLRRFPNHT